MAIVGVHSALGRQIVQSQIKFKHIHPRLT